MLPIDKPSTLEADPDPALRRPRHAAPPHRSAAKVVLNQHLTDKRPGRSGARRAWGAGLLVLAALTWAGSGCVRDLDPGELPEVRYTAPINAYVGQTIRFDASSSFDPEGSIAWFTFDFGDGTAGVRGRSPEVEHAYEQAGSFVTRVTVVDDANNKFTELREIVIVERGVVPHLVCQRQRPYCPPFFVCTEELRCVADVDGDGVAGPEDEDEPACDSDASCPPQWRCRDALCVF